MNPTQKTPESIITEIHVIREHLAEKYQNDLTAYSHAAEEHCRALGFNTVQSPRLQRSLDEIAKAS